MHFRVLPLTSHESWDGQAVRAARVLVLETLLEHLGAGVGIEILGGGVI